MMMMPPAIVLAAASVLWATAAGPAAHQQRHWPRGSSAIRTVKRAGGSHSSSARGRASPVSLSAVRNDTVTLDNSIVSIELNVKAATMTAYRLGGVNLLETNPTAYDLYEKNAGHVGAYFSSNAQTAGVDGTYWNPENTSYQVVHQTDEMVEVMMATTSTHFFDHEFHFVLRRGDHGVYIYVVISHRAGQPATDLQEYRMTWWPRVSNAVGNGTQFFDRVILDRSRNWVQPTNLEIAAAFAETVPGDAGAHVPGGPAEVARIETGRWRGRLYSKYMYSADYAKVGTWGVSSTEHGLGFWVVCPNFEGQNDGPSKNDLTEYLMHFQRDHYAGSSVQIGREETWSKLVGPFLLYANSLSNHEERWEDAKLQHLAEKAAWPYSWMTHPLYQATTRSEVRGRLLINDALKPMLSGADAWVGLAPPPTNASDPQSGWQEQGRDYEYWTRADGGGRFAIQGVRPGTHTLFAWNAGVVRELRLDGVEVSASAVVHLGNVTLTVPRAPGHVIVWEVGIPNRGIGEFFHGSTDWWEPLLHLTFPKDFPNPLIYEPKSCNWSRAVNYAQSRYFGLGSADRGSDWTWRFEFDLARVTGDALLTVAFAAMDADLYLFVNQNDKDPPLVRQASAFYDDTLIRQGSHGKYQWFNFTLPAGRLLHGRNVLGFQASSSNMGAQISLMYDYISLEMPARSGADRLHPGQCWSSNPGWGADVFLTPSLDPHSPQSCRRNVVYFDPCLLPPCPRRTGNHNACAALCEATAGCAVFTTNKRGECYLRASAEDPRGDDAANGSVSCPMRLQ